MGNELITRDQLQSDLEDLYNNKISPYLNGTTHTGFTPIGTVIDFLGTTAPSHYLECDGSIYNIADYSDLANYFETAYGSKNNFGGDGTITFAVPTITGDEDIIKCICAVNNYIDYALDGFPVAVTNPQDKQGLTFDAATQKWVNGAGGLHEYSTTEKVIGTWIDGRPVYEKTLIYGPFNANNKTSTFNASINSNNDFDHIIALEGGTYRTQGNYHWNCGLQECQSTAQLANTYYDPFTDLVYYRNISASGYENLYLIVVIKWLKTSILSS